MNDGTALIDRKVSYTKQTNQNAVLLPLARTIPGSLSKPGLFASFRYPLQQIQQHEHYSANGAQSADYEKGEYVAEFPLILFHP